MLKARYYQNDGSEGKAQALPEWLFDGVVHEDVLHQVIKVYLSNQRQGTAAAKSRGQVKGGGRKPWRQKGLGRARHGSIRSPQWVGGGVAHGPKPRDYSQRTPKKMKRLALYSALSARASEGCIKVVEDIGWASPKTKQAVGLLDAIDAGGKILFVLTSLDGVAGKSFRNLPEVRLVEPGHLTPYDVLWSDQVVFTSHTMGSVGRNSSYEVSDSDFVIDVGGDS